MAKESVSYRVLTIALIVSLICIAFSAVFLFTFEYQRRTAAIEKEIQNLRDAQFSGVVEALWNYDYTLLQALLDGLHFHVYINYASVEDINGYTLSTGEHKEESIIRSYPLVRDMDDGSIMELGTLHLEIDSQRILSDVTRQILLLLFFQALFLFVEFFIVVFLFSRVVTRHLAQIADYIRHWDAKPGAPSLSLEKTIRGDEFDILVESFNTMRQNLEVSRKAEIKAMEELKESEEMNRILVEEAPDAILMYDMDLKRFISCNRRSEILFERSREELFNIPFTELYTPDQPDGFPVKKSVLENDKRALAGESLIFQRHIRIPKGGIKICEVRMNRFPSSDRKILRVSYLDITERVRAEEEVVRSLREKEVLLQEVYHRTKNNMQVIASFLNMQAMASSEKNVKDVLNEMIGRITAMALVHQKLYESKDLSRIDLAEYLMDLILEIKNAYLGNRQGIEIDLEAENGIIFLLDTAIPCGLAVNELIVNAVKYAFPDGKKGTIRVNLSRDAQGMIIISVKDDGIGFPPGFDFRVDGKLGIQTVISLIELQLNGSLSFGAGPGTACTLTLNDDLYTEST